MVFQYQYQYQYQLQRGLGLVTYDSFSSLLHDVSYNPVLLSFLVAVLPLLAFALRGRIVKTSAYRTLHALYLERRRQKQLKQARTVFEETFLGKKKKEISTLLLIGFTVLLGGLIFTQSLFFVAVTSNSMAPTFWNGDLVMVQSLSRDYQKGDVVVFQDPEVSYKHNVIHRIDSITGSQIRTKGDNNGFPDEWILSSDEILGTAVTMDAGPVVAKNVGQYFIRDYDPFKEQDPTYQYLRGAISNIHTYGPLYLIAIFLLVILSLLQQPERSKVY